jgi:hypothetical protein
MNELRFSCDWLTVEVDDAVSRDTTAQLSIHVGDTCLTRNEDVWSKTVRDSVLVSAYPLAMWLAASWWRLQWEPLPKVGERPSVDWRMAHEVGAANHGFVWPRILFASDGEAVHVWAEATGTQGQSVNYLCGLESPRPVAIDGFARSVDSFIESVLSRLSATDHRETALASLWQLVREDRADVLTNRKRRLEALMGFDPEQCPQAVLARVLELQQQLGDPAMSELAPAFFGSRNEAEALARINSLIDTAGLPGKPAVMPSQIGLVRSTVAPWQHGVQVARQLRSHISNTSSPISNAKLSDLLGLTEQQAVHAHVASRSPAAIAKPANDGSYVFVPRKKHPAARRFELARFLGDHLREPDGQAGWLASTDLATSRQKYQRAFAAELLCPIDSLADFLGGDYSESALEDAAEHFDVSEQTVEFLLVNNGLLESPYAGQNMPYRLAA